MDSPVSEEMFYMNLVRVFCKEFEEDVIANMNDFFKVYDCRKSFDKSRLAKIIRTFICGLDRLKYLIEENT